MMTLLELIQQVCSELALSQPSSVIGSQDKRITQMHSLLNRLGADLVRQFEWQRLQNEHLVTTVAVTLSGTTVIGSKTITVSDTTGLTTQYGVAGTGIQPFAQIESVPSLTNIVMNMPATASGTVDITFAQNEYTLPSDWGNQIPQTEWDRTNRWPLIGPQSPQDWQSFKSGIVYAGPRERFRIQQGELSINPSPPNGLIFAFEYISRGWVESSTGLRKTSFTENTDTSIFPDSLLITGLKTQWKAAKGIDASFDLSEFKSLLELCKAQDKSAPKLYLSSFGGSVLLSEYNLPDGNFPG